MDRYLYFNGHSSEEYGAHIEYKPNIPTPAAKLQEYVVPGRSGKLHADLGYYDDITVTYQLYFHGKRPTAEELRPIKDWLCASPGPHDLADGYDPGYFYRATATMSSTKNILDRYGRFQAQFSCDPRHFAVAGQQPQNLTSGQKLFNPYAQTAKPLWEITGNGLDGTLEVNGHTFKLTTSSDQHAFLECETEDAYLADGTNINPTTSGPYPTLQPGENTVSWSGGITGVIVTPRWWTL